MSDVTERTLKAVRYLAEPWRSEVLMDAAKLGIEVLDVAPGGEGFLVEFSDGSRFYYDDDHRSCIQQQEAT